jgi:hypothetical protein
MSSENDKVFECFSSEFKKFTDNIKKLIEEAEKKQQNLSEIFQENEHLCLSKIFADAVDELSRKNIDIDIDKFSPFDLPRI